MSIDRTAYPRFGRVVSAVELAEVFTPTVDKEGWARERTVDAQHRLVLMVWLKCYQRLGYFPKLAEVPQLVVAHVRDALGRGGDVVAAQEGERTAKRHRQWVRERLGVIYESARVRAVAEAAIRMAVVSKDNPADLINGALEELVRARCELPGYSTLDAMATIRAEVNIELFARVTARIDLAARAGLARLLLVDPVTRRSEFDALKAPATHGSEVDVDARVRAGVGVVPIWFSLGEDPDDGPRRA